MLSFDHSRARQNPVCGGGMGSIPGAGGSATGIGMGPGQGGGGSDRWRQEAGVRSSPNTKHAQLLDPCSQRPQSPQGARQGSTPSPPGQDGGREGGRTRSSRGATGPRTECLHKQGSDGASQASPAESGGQSAQVCPPSQKASGGAVAPQPTLRGVWSLP